MTSSHVDNLFIRMDKLGDLILSLNADEWAPIQSHNNHWWISKGSEFIPELAEPQRSWTSFSKNFSFSEFKTALRWLKSHRPRTAFVFHAPWWVGAALFLAKVPYRVGRLSQWHSFLFFNYGVRQSRSQGDRHESQYNIDLMHAGFQKIQKRLLTPSPLPAPLRLKAPPLTEDLLHRHGLQGRNYFIVHPGMAGSALNWPTSYYADLIRALVPHIPVAITGSAMDRPYLDPLKKELKDLNSLIWLDERLEIRELMYVLSRSRGLLAPSTGVLHLAASLGVPSFGIYSPKRVQRPLRWGPRGSQAFIFVPKGIGPDQAVDAECMKRISVSSVLSALIAEIKK
jgi:ADP-heptose:LPS heptosyltransferase